MIDYLLYIGVRISGFFVRLFPLRLTLWFGRRLGDLGYWLGMDRRRIALDNLKSAFGDEKNYEEFHRITRKVFQNLGMSFIEVLNFPGLDAKYLERYIKTEGLSHIDEALKENKGIIFLGGHFGNWELAGFAISVLGHKVKLLAREQKLMRLNRLLDSYREWNGCKVIPKKRAVREIIKGLSNNEMIGILADQDGGKKGVFVNFFGRPASTPEGAIAFALKTGCAILPTLIIRENGARHTLKIESPLRITRSGNYEADIKTNLQVFTSILESYVRRYPEQWLWVHKRWKTQPEN